MAPEPIDEILPLGTEILLALGAMSSSDGVAARIVDAVQRQAGPLAEKLNSNPLEVLCPNPSNPDEARSNFAKALEILKKEDSALGYGQKWLVHDPSTPNLEIFEQILLTGEGFRVGQFTLEREVIDAGARIGNLRILDEQAKQKSGLSPDFLNSIDSLKDPTDLNQCVSVGNTWDATPSSVCQLVLTSDGLRVEEIATIHIDRSKWSPINKNTWGPVTEEALVKSGLIEYGFSDQILIGALKELAA